MAQVTLLRESQAKACATKELIDELTEQLKR